MKKLRKENLSTLLNVSPDSYNANELSISLESLVNQTDFIDLGTLLRMFEVDVLDECIDKVRNETAIGIQHVNQESIAKV